MICGVSCSRENYTNPSQKKGKRRSAYHLRQASSRDDVARVYEAVEVASGFFYRLAHLIVAVQIEDVGDKVQGILVILYLNVQAGKVEAVGQIIFVDLAKVLVAPGRYKL